MSKLLNFIQCRDWFSLISIYFQNLGIDISVTYTVEAILWINFYCQDVDLFENIIMKRGVLFEFSHNYRSTKLAKLVKKLPSIRIESGTSCVHLWYLTDLANLTLLVRLGLLRFLYTTLAKIHREQSSQAGSLLSENPLKSRDLASLVQRFRGIPMTSCPKICKLLHWL